MPGRTNRPRETSHERCHAGLDLTSEDEVGGTAAHYLPWRVRVGHTEGTISGMGWLVVSGDCTRTAGSPTGSGTLSRTASHFLVDLVVNDVPAVGYFGRAKHVLLSSASHPRGPLSPCQVSMQKAISTSPRAAPPPLAGCQAVVVCLSIDLVTGLSPRWDGKRFEMIGESLLLLLLLLTTSGMGWTWSHIRSRSLHSA